MTLVGRLMMCTRCTWVWDVLEIPEGWIDPARYVCPDCRRPSRAQLQIIWEPWASSRVDRPDYTPEMAGLGY